MSPRPCAISHQPLAMTASLNIPILLDRLCYRYPSVLVDAIAEHDKGRRLVAVKNVTVNEEFFQGHFPGVPLMPGVLILESWSQVAAMLLVHRDEARPNARVYLRGVNDAKFHGEETRLTIGRRNIFREFVTIHRGTEGGGGVTTIGDRNLFMAYVHVAHDCHVGNNTIFGNMATLGGHVQVEDYVNISAGSGVHQFCRVGRHAFIGGYSVVTKDALPYARTVGSRPARIFGTNTIGLMRRGFAPDVITKLKRSFRYLLQSKLNTTIALQQIEQDSSLACPEVRYLIDFIRTSQRGVILRRASRRTEEIGPDD